MKRIYKTITHWLREWEAPKASKQSNPLAEERISESEIILNVKRQALTAASNGVKKEDFRKASQLDVLGMSSQSKADFGERIAVVQERLKSGSAYLEEIKSNREKHIQIQIANLPEERHIALDKLESKLKTSRHKVNRLKAELLNLNLL